MKTHKGIKKRFKVTATGKLRYKHASGSHLMSSKNAKKRKRIAGPAIMTGVYAKMIKAIVRQIVCWSAERGILPG